MKKTAILFSLLVPALSAMAGHITIKGGTPSGALTVAEYNVNDMRSAGRATPLATANAAFDAEGNFSFETTAKEPRLYVLANYADISHTPYIFANPDDDITVAYSAGSIYPSVTGTPLMEAIAPVQQQRDRLMNDFQALARRDDVAREAKREAYDRMFAAMGDIARANTANPGSVFMIQMLPVATVSDVIDLIEPSAADNMLAALFADSRQAVQAWRKRMEAKAAIAPGKPAPDFTLPNLEGRQVSLSSLRGKFVIIDFWGSWCGWCIKGFPKLREAYGRLKDRVEVVGIDCGDSPETWRAAVAKHQLPWINLYQADDAAVSVPELYGVDGFPTKLIIGPDGTIRNVTVGEDPEFFKRLDEILN